MKKIGCILILILYGHFLKAQGANAVIFSENGEKFTVYINEVMQNNKPETSVKILNMPEPKYKMKIFFEDVRLGETSFILFLEAGMERTFSLSKNSKGKYVLRFISAVPIKTDKAAINTSTVKSQNTNTSTNKIGKDTLDVEVNPNVNIFQTDVNVAERPVYLPGYGGPIGCEKPITDQAFLEIKNNIGAKSFEETKLTAAKQLLLNQCLLTTQVKQLAKLFTFEETKLEFAKYAYGYTYDIDNYYKVNDIFTFENSVEDLNNYIKNLK